MKTPPEKIVADGGLRLWRAKDYFAVRRRIVREVKEQHAREIGATSFIRGFALWFRIHREVRARMKKEFPVGALYLHQMLAAEEPIQPPEPTRAAVRDSGVSPAITASTSSARAAHL